MSTKEYDDMIFELQNTNPKTMDERLRVSEEQNTVLAAKMELLQSELAHSNTVIQQLVEERCNEDHVSSNQQILSSLGLHAPIGMPQK